MVIQTAVGWILDVSHDISNDDINLIIKLQVGKVISFKQTLKENTFYILPKSQLVGEDLFKQLSRNDQLIKKIFWDEKNIDLADKNKTRLIGISTNIPDNQTQLYRAFIKKLRMDSRVRIDRRRLGRNNSSWCWKSPIIYDSITCSRICDRVYSSCNYHIFP